MLGTSAVPASALRRAELGHVVHLQMMLQVVLTSYQFTARSASLPQSPQVTPAQPPQLQPPPAAPAAEAAAPAEPAAAAVGATEANQPGGPPRQLQFGDGIPPIDLSVSAGSSPLEAFAPQKD